MQDAEKTQRAGEIACSLNHKENTMFYSSEEIITSSDIMRLVNYMNIELSQSKQDSLKDYVNTLLIEKFSSGRNRWDSSDVVYHKHSFLFYS